MNKNLLKKSFIFFVAGIILSILSISFLNIFNHNLPGIDTIISNGWSYYAISTSAVFKYFYPGFILLIISFIPFAAGIILFALGLFRKESVDGDARRRYILISSFILYCFTAGLVLEVIVNFAFLKFYVKTISTAIQNYYLFGFNLLIAPIVLGIVGTVIGIVGNILKNKHNENEIQFSERTFNLKGEKLRSPFILILIAIGSSFITMSLFIIFNTGIIKARTASQHSFPFTYSEEISAPIVNYGFLLGFFIITVSLIIFAIGIIMLTTRIIGQIKKNKQNPEQKRLLLTSLFMIFPGFFISIIAYIRFLSLSIEIPAVNNDLINPGYLITPSAIYDYYFPGFMIFTVSMVFSIIGFIILRGWISIQRNIGEESQIIPEQMVTKKRNNIELSIILTSIATAMSIFLLIILKVFNGYIANAPITTPFCGCMGNPSPTGIFMTSLGALLYYTPGFVLYTIILVLYITGIILFVKGNNKIDRAEENSKNAYIRKDFLRIFFVSITIGTVLSLIAYSRFILFNEFFSFPTYLDSSGYFISNSLLQNYYIPGFYFFEISLSLYIVGLISIILQRILSGKNRK